MRYSKIFDATKLDEIPELLQVENYGVYVSYCDALYAVTDAYDDEYENGQVYIVSEETYGVDSEMTVKRLLDLLSECDYQSIKCNPADNIDKSLDLQMEEISDVTHIAIDDICNTVLLIVG